jgi:aminopeptidase YwaD
MLAGCMGGNTSTVKEVVSNPNSKPEEYLKAEMIQKDNIMNTIKELSSEKYKGRLAGTIGNSEASKYIADYFANLGLINPEGLENYMQYFQMPLIELTEKPVLQILDKSGKVQIDFDYAEDFVLRRLSSETDTIQFDAPMYLVKDSTEIMSKNDKFKGKIILIPWEFYNILGSQNQPADFAKACGALGAIGEFNLKENSLGYRYLKTRPLYGDWMFSDSYKPFAFAKEDAFAKLAEAARNGGKLHFSCSSKISISGTTANVIGLIPGSDPKLKDEYIIIGSHFDHVGDNMDGTYNPGSLDNASGVAAMMEVAKLIKGSKIPPKKSILFIAFNGEESGLFGSAYYAKCPIYPLGKAVMINLDMVGSAAEIPLTLAIFSDKTDASLRDTLADYADILSIAYEKGVENGSDHTPFGRHGVPSVCLINMDMKHGYHSPHDTIETVNEDKLEEVVKLVLYYVEKNAY